MTSTQVIKTSVTNNSSFCNYHHPGDQTIWTKESVCLASKTTMHDITSTVFICTYCSLIIWTIIMLTVERTLGCLCPDLCNEVFVTFATWIFNSQYKGSRHGFFDDCLGNSDVPRGKKSILNVSFTLHPGAGEQAELKKHTHPGCSWLSRTKESRWQMV